MKKAVLIAISLVSLVIFPSAQDVIQNPAKPSNSNAGRILKLKEEMRIEDTRDGFYFKNPRAIRVSPRGEILILDDQVLLFDSQGRFLRNLLKKGQGPGELSSVLDIGTSGDRFFLVGYPPKILAFDTQGTLVMETEIREAIKGQTSLISTENQRFLLLSMGPPERPAGSGLADFPNYLFKVSLGGTVIKAGTFSLQGYYQVYSSGATSWSFSNSVHIAPISNAFLAVNSSPEYLVGLFDVEKETFVRRFTRPYRRVKRSTEGGVSGSGGDAPPPPEFAPDIRALHAVDGKIWVQTSTVVEQKGILFDVFDLQGQYLDCFYIPTTRKDPKNKPGNMIFTIAGGYAYFSDKTEDDLIVIKKCRIVGL